MCSNIPSQTFLLPHVMAKPASGAECQWPQVTVVTVCYNALQGGRRDLLLRNLASVQEQRGVQLEHLIIDGASTDGTTDFIRAFENTRHEMRLLSLADKGIYEAMNRGIALARGQYVIFLNSDDCYHNADGLAAAVKALEHDASCDFTFGPITPVGPHTRHSPHRNPEARLHKFTVFCTIPHPSILYRRQLLLDMGGYDVRYRSAADYDLNLRIIARGHRGRYVPENFVTFQAGGFSDVNRNGIALQEKVQVVWEFHKDRFGADLSQDEAEKLVLRCRYPRRYLWLYKRAQQLIRDSFLGLPMGIGPRLGRLFNYGKYYLYCLCMPG